MSWKPNQAYVQYMDAHGEWQATEVMPIERAQVLAANMMPHQMAFVRLVCEAG